MSLYAEDSFMSDMGIKLTEQHTLSHLKPFSYIMGVDETAPDYAGSILLQQCNSATARNQPLTCGELCAQRGVSGEDLEECRLDLLRNHECCDTDILCSGRVHLHHAEGTPDAKEHADVQLDNSSVQRQLRHSARAPEIVATMYEH